MPYNVYSLNDSGQIGGSFTDGSDTGILVYGSPTQFPGIQTPSTPLYQTSYTLNRCAPGQSAWYGAVNNVDIIAGECGTQGAVFDQSTSPSLFGIANAAATLPTAISNGGRIAGWYVYPSNQGDGIPFEYDGSGFIEIVVPNSVGAITTGINDNNQIVGYFLGTDSALYGFITGASSVVNYFQLGKLLGGCNCSGKALVGNPIDVAFGNMSEHFTDYTTAGQNPLSFVRYYNSLKRLVADLSLDRHILQEIVAKNL